MAKAYIVGNGARAVISFGETATEARAHADLDGVEYVERNATRAPQFDDRSGNPPTPRELVQFHDWWHECRCCGRSVWGDEPDHHWFDAYSVACSDACKAAGDARDAARKAANGG